MRDGLVASLAAQLRERTDWLVAMASGALAIAVTLVLPGHWHIVVAGVVVSGVAALLLRPEVP